MASRLIITGRMTPTARLEWPMQYRSNRSSKIELLGDCRTPTFEVRKSEGTTIEPRRYRAGPSGFSSTCFPQPPSLETSRQLSRRLFPRGAAWAIHSRYRGNTIPSLKLLSCLIRQALPNSKPDPDQVSPMPGLKRRIPL